MVAVYFVSSITDLSLTLTRSQQDSCPFTILKQCFYRAYFVSKSKPVKIGVPQGSLLGPRLFITYVNDLPDSIRGGEVYMYADDTTIYTFGDTTDEVARALQVILDQLQTWCQMNRLIIHKGKCDAVLLDTKPFIGPLNPLVWGDKKTFEYRSFSVCLGIAIDERLSWANHENQSLVLIQL